jgi:putative hydrolase of the HAD superfamily
MINTIIFDIGNVLMRFNPEAYIHAVYETETADRIYDAMFSSGLWGEIDRGVLTDEQMIQRFLRVEPSLETEIRYIYTHMGGFTNELKASKPWLKRLRDEGFHLYYLSNYSFLMRSLTQHELSVLEQMEGGIFSCDVRLLKPDPAIYQLLMSTYHLKAEQCAFLDDSQRNVDTAVSLHMKGIHVLSQQQAIHDLDVLLQEEK